MKIFFTIVFVIFAFGKLIEFFEKKQNNARLEKKLAFKKQVTKIIIIIKASFMLI